MSLSGENGLESKGLGGLGSFGLRPKGKLVVDVLLRAVSKIVGENCLWEGDGQIWKTPLTSGDGCVWSAVIGW